MNARIDDIIKGIEHMMYGHNFEVCICIKIFQGKTTIDFNKL